MEAFSFIHGSSVGQSNLIPEGPREICNDISLKFFQGRELRRDKSGAKLALFIEHYKGHSGHYCVYSFVNNDCKGSNGREGQYFAISILSDRYAPPEDVFRKVLSSAYEAMFATGKILRKDGDTDQYVIGQFSEQEQYLSALLGKINTAFLQIAGEQARSVGTDVIGADYQSWNGFKAGLDICNNTNAFDEFCRLGRLYVSEEYGTQSDRIREYEATIQKLDDEKHALERSIGETLRKGQAESKKTIEQLREQLSQKNADIVTLQADNERFKSSIEVVRAELERHSKATSRLMDLKEQSSSGQNKGKKDIWKTGLLLGVLILTLLSSLLNYCFFRSIASSLGPQKENPKVNVSNKKDGLSDNPVSETPGGVFLEVSPSLIEANADKGDYAIEVVCDQEWAVPESATDGVSFKKTDATHLSIHLTANPTASPRESTFMIPAGALEKQVTVKQSGKTKEASAPDYGLVVKDADGRVLQSGRSTVKRDQRLHAVVNKPSMQQTGYGWRYDNCKGPKDNVKEVDVIITGEPGKKAVIAYGDVTSQSLRQRVFLTIVDDQLSTTSSSTSGQVVESTQDVNDSSGDGGNGAGDADKTNSDQ